MSVEMWHEVVLTEEANRTACRHLLQHYATGQVQEDLCFGLWTPSRGLNRETAIVTRILLPGKGERELHGNASFDRSYLTRVTRAAIRNGQGLAFMHSHPSDGWQDMSRADVRAERDRISDTVMATSRPLVGMTVGTDGHWSARVWEQTTRGKPGKTRHWSRKVRVVERSRLIVWRRPSAAGRDRKRQKRTVDSWGEDKQRMLEGLRVGVIGLGSVGSIVAEGLARIGVREMVLIDHDVVEEHNLDRLLNASVQDIGRAKTDVAAAAVRTASSADRISVINIRKRIQHSAAYAAARDCDILVCCVDSPVARDVVNRVAFRDAIPVVDGGVEIRKTPDTGNMNAARWKAHVINPYNECLRCKGQYSSSDVMLELDGSWENPGYIRGTGRSVPRRENVFSLSLATASELLNMTVRMVIADDWWPAQDGIERNLVTGRTKGRTGRCVDTCTIYRERWTGDAAAAIGYLEPDEIEERDIERISPITRVLQNMLAVTRRLWRGR